MKKSQYIKYWLYTGSALIVLMVIVGGITRLTESGLSMVDWRLFMGSIPPLTEADWVATFQKYQQFPEFKELNYRFTLEDFKSIFWWEYLHRLLGRTIGLVFIIPFVIFLVKKWLTKAQILQFGWLFILGGTQGLIGWWMVKSGLNLEPRVSHYRLAVHLITALITYSFTIYYALRIDQGAKLKLGAKTWINGLLVLLFVQIIYGAFVAGLDAGKIHNNFPLMEQGIFIAESVFIMDPWYQNFIENKSGIQFVHRMLAFALLIFGGGFIYKFSNLANNKGVQFFAIALLLQFSLGVLTVLLAVPVWLGVAHQLGALILLTSVLKIKAEVD